MRRITPILVISSALLLSACATTNPRQQETPTDIFIDNTLRQYGVGPGGRISTPDAVLVDPTPEAPEEDEAPLVS